jgi:hypothetical protein
LTGPDWAKAGAASRRQAAEIEAAPVRARKRRRVVVMGHPPENWASPVGAERWVFYPRSARSVMLEFSDLPEQRGARVRTILGNARIHSVAR